jgi:hypothetical protein
MDLYAVELMRLNERSTPVYARVLEITHLPFAEQKRIVKRVKDKLKKRVERAGGGDG